MGAGGDSSGGMGGAGLSTGSGTNGGAAGNGENGGDLHGVVGCACDVGGATNGTTTSYMLGMCGVMAMMVRQRRNRVR
jgi:hypothetical protein